jgi:biopolymer transport protein ExbB
VFHLIKAGGWLMLPIVVCSILALAIVLERFWTLRRRSVMPQDLTAKVWRWHHDGQVTRERVHWLRNNSP